MTTTKGSPSPDQAAALDRVAAWLRAAPPALHCDAACAGGEPHTHGRARGHPVLAVGGLAGTGKTWLAGQLAANLGASVAYGAPTHRAAAVLRGKLPPAERDRVRTYHSLLYQARATYTCLVSGEPMTRVPCGCADPGDCRCDRRFEPCGRDGTHECRVQEHLSFSLRRFLGGHRDLVVLDEASMVTEERVAEIASLGVPVLLVGDHGQLPPVRAPVSPWMRAPDVVLLENHRQGEASGIVAAALQARGTGRLALGRYGDGSTVVTSAALRPEVLEVAGPDRLPPGPDRAVIVHTNRMRAAVNRGYREGLGLAGAALAAGDRVVALQNGDLPVSSREGGLGDGIDGWRPDGAMTFVYNGTCGTVEAVAPPRRARQPWLDAVIHLDADARGEPGTRVQARLAVAQLGADHRLRPDEHAARHGLWDLAYALTCHKAQGSEYDDVVVLDTGAPDWRRWIYTAMTRARRRLVVVNWSRG